MAKVRFLDNGQGYFDFDHLLSITNEEFVNRVQSVLESDHFSNAVVSIKEDKYDVSIVICDAEGLISRFLTFDRGLNSFEEILLTCIQLEQLFDTFKKAGAFNG